jgi:hypothetical protein
VAPIVTLTTPENTAHARKHRVACAAAELVIAIPGVALLVCALGANQQWLDRHVLPSFLLQRDTLVWFETAARIVIGTVGAWLVLIARPRVNRFVTRAPARAFPIALAVVLAIGASEPALRTLQWRPAGWLTPDDEPRRQSDARLGWTFVPSRVGHARVGGRDVEYVLDAAGYRVESLTRPVDFARPALLFTGESVMFGEGLMWEESIPGQVERTIGEQSANLAVHGYGNDQAFLKLQTDLPRFRRPLAVVSLFMTTLFGRNLDQERPHLRPGLLWAPPKARWRIESLARLLVPYRSDHLIEEGIVTTRQVLLATVALARARDATPLIVVPQFGVETEPEARIRRRVFDGLVLPVVMVRLDPSWRLPWDRHPDARAAHAIAEAIALRLRESRVLGPTRGERK